MRIEKILIMLVLILAALMVVNFEIVSTKKFKNNDNKLHGYIIEIDEPVAFLKNKNFIIKDFAIILR